MGDWATGFEAALKWTLKQQGWNHIVMRGDNCVILEQLDHTLPTQDLSIELFNAGHPHKFVNSSRKEQTAKGTVKIPQLIFTEPSPADVEAYAAKSDAGTGTEFVDPRVTLTAAPGVVSSSSSHALVRNRGACSGCVNALVCIAGLLVICAMWLVFPKHTPYPHPTPDL